jgi:hypothetical protein
MPIDYSQSKIYKISSPQSDKVYIGSTVKTLNRRLTQHKHSSNRTTSKDIIKYNDAIIELLEDYPCETREQLIQKECEWIKKTGNCINQVVPVREVEYTDFIVFQDNTQFIILSETERCFKVIPKKTPVDAPPLNTYPLSASNMISALKEYRYDTERKKRKYHAKKEQRIKEWEKRQAENETV